MARSASQSKLFDTGLAHETGLLYKPEFITPDEETLLIAFIESLPLRHGRGGPEQQYRAKRRSHGFGWDYDFQKEKFIPGPPLPRFLQRFARRIAKYLDISPARVVEAFINEYSTGTPLGFHKDNEPFEHIAGISLSGWSTMRFRPLRTDDRSPEKIIEVELEPRSLYVMRKKIRDEYQHSVKATRALRYSITFRTLPAGTPIRAS